MSEALFDYTAAGIAGPLVCAVLAENEVLRRELAVVLRRLPAVDAIHQCPDWSEVERLLRSGRIDVLILNSGHGHRLRASRRHDGRPKTLLLIEEAEAADPGPLADLPVDGFLLRQQLSARSLHEAIRRMRGGEIPMPTVLARQLLGRAGGQPGTLRPAELTARENETLALLAEGLSNKQIARRLRISEHGVKRLVGSLLLKLGSPNRTTAVITAMKFGIIQSV